MAITLTEHIAAVLEGYSPNAPIGPEDLSNIIKVRELPDGGLVVIVQPGAKHVFAPLDVQVVRAQLQGAQHAETGETTAPPEPSPPSQVSPSPAPAPARVIRRQTAVGKRKRAKTDD